MDISGSDTYTRWINSHKHGSIAIRNLHVKNEYNTQVLIARFNNHHYVYGMLLINSTVDNTINDVNSTVDVTDNIEFVIFGPTLLSNDGRYQRYISEYSYIQSQYDVNSDKYSKLESIINNMISNETLQLLTVSVLSEKLTYYNIMILSIVINLSVQDIVNHSYEQYMDPVFIKLVKLIYSSDKSILTNPYITFDNICTKIISEKNDDNYNEINTSIQLNKLIASNVVKSFPIIIDWTIINSPIFVNKWIVLINQYVGHPLSSASIFNSDFIFEMCHLFELMYALHVLHMRCHVVHNDINLDNITYKLKNTNTVNVYILSEYGECDTYVFNSNANIYIIDFGNSINNTDSDNIKYNVKNIYSKYVTDDKFIVDDNDLLFSLLCLNDYKQLCRCFQKIQTNMTELLYNMNELLDNIIMNIITEKNIDYNNQILSMFNNMFNLFLYNDTDVEYKIESINCIYNMER